MAICAVSVIIPLYNAEKFINQCLLSVLAQEFKDFEVLVIDDCSTDNSRTEVEKFLPHFGERLKILSTEKNSGGAGVPRNVGIQHAAGKYVTFVDDDDMIMPSTLSDFYTAAEEFGADVVHSERFINFSGEDLKSAKSHLESGEHDGDFVSEPTLESEDFEERIARYLRGKFFWLPWGKLYRRDFLLSNEINFPQMRFSEDLVFCFKCVCLARRYLRVPFVNNIHRILDSSAARNYNLRTWLIVATRTVNLLDQFMSGQEFFKRNLDLHYAVLKFVTDKAFYWIRALSEAKPYETYELFYECLRSAKLDARGKDILAAYLFAERTMIKTK